MERQILWGNIYADWEVLKAENLTGGVILIWDKRVVEKLNVWIGRFFVSCQWKGIDDWFFLDGYKCLRSYFGGN